MALGVGERRGVESHLERLRQAEWETVRAWFKPGMRVLDLGGGSGFQASLIAAHGCEVVSIDLADRLMPPHLFYPVQDYDGRHIPATDASFDIIFSSNVLEHIQPLAPIFVEMRRTLKPDGLAIHIVPSATWRYWTSMSHFGFAIKRLLGTQRTVPGATTPVSLRGTLQHRGLIHLLTRILPLNAHGEYPNAVAELYYFSRKRWLSVFAAQGFTVIRASGTGLFYTGFGLLPRLSLHARRWMARVAGSACHIFIAGLPPDERR